MVLAVVVVVVVVSDENKSSCRWQQSFVVVVIGNAVLELTVTQTAERKRGERETPTRSANEKRGPLTPCADDDYFAWFRARCLFVKKP